jgi:hypothetical protein
LIAVRRRLGSRKNVPLDKQKLLPRRIGWNVDNYWPL